ncbi:M23 family metallopeptidase [Kribbella sp. NPDC051718]|uniref:M23 family metallopeptidase n=1 Tax=Kribbella sp. NPDC051718 TaxID=3155168 RepID=UPI00341570E8
MTPTLLATAALLAPTTPTTTAAPVQPGAVWPLTPRPEVVRGFEPPPKPWLPGHRGLDLRGSPGQQVRSATSGTVTYAGPLAGRGVIVIATGPLRTTYEPVIPTVRTGTFVTPGTPLGHLSAAASHCTPATCLHWGLLQSTTYLNPLSLLPHRPVRLLPNTPQPHRANTQASGTQLSHGAAPSPDPSHLEPPAPPRSSLASSVVVGLAAIGTLIGSLLIRRH